MYFPKKDSTEAAEYMCSKYKSIYRTTELYTYMYMIYSNMHKHCVCGNDVYQDITMNMFTYGKQI